MALWQGISRRKPSGGRLRPAHKKRKFEIGREPHLPTIGEEKRKSVRIRGGQTRIRILQASVAYVTDPKTNKTVKAEIKTVTDNPANPNFIRRNIITKGAIVVTSKGKARVTSRPGQDGTISAVLVE
ncbi:MAG TPA: 30S ribosomal protein S8e [Candidatus Thermoplasmatota archaeon]|nr:30S ribosomal protein S8e [Candidatus Thermoplasmatota archaeon]